MITQKQQSHDQPSGQGQDMHPVFTPAGFTTEMVEVVSLEGSFILRRVHDETEAMMGRPCE